MPLVDGVPGQFGRAVVLDHGDNPREAQLIAGAGLDGLASLDLGGRGMWGKVTGFLYGSTLAEFKARWQALSRLQDGRAHVLHEDLVDFAWDRAKFSGLKNTSKKLPNRGQPSSYNYWVTFEMDVLMLDYEDDR